MPLEKPASAKPSPDDSVIERSCLYCGQVHTLARAKLAPDALTINCKSCSRPLPLKLKEPARLDIPLKSQALQSRAAKPAIRPAVQSLRPPDILTITCAGCAKKYNIRREKIPPTTRAIKCKACGHPMGLPAANGLPLSHESASQDTMPAGDRPGNKIRLYAMAAGIILVVMIGTFTARRFFNDQFGQVSAKQAAASAALLKAGPFLALNLNLPLILENLDRGVEEDKKTLKFQTTAALVKSLKLRRLELFLYADSKNQILPVIMTGGSNAKHLEKMFDRQEPLEKYFERKSPGIFRFKKEALDQADKYKFPAEPYQMTLLGRSALLAPVSFSAAIAADMRLLLNTDMARFAKSISEPNDLARMAIRVPADIQKGWEKKIQEKTVLGINPQVAMIAKMGAGILSELSDSLKPVDAMALGFRFTAQNVRTLSYAQRFRTGVDGDAVYRMLRSGNLQDVDVDSVIKILIEIFQDRRYGRKLQFADNRLTLEFSWRKKDDQLILTALSKAPLGQLFAQSMALTPTPGPVAAE